MHNSAELPAAGSYIVRDFQKKGNLLGSLLLFEAFQ